MYEEMFHFLYFFFFSEKIKKEILIQRKFFFISHFLVFEARDRKNRILWSYIGKERVNGTGTSKNLSVINHSHKVQTPFYTCFLSHSQYCSKNISACINEKVLFFYIRCVNIHRLKALFILFYERRSVGHYYGLFLGFVNFPFYLSSNNATKGF